MGWGFADKVRKQMMDIGIGGKEFTVMDIADRLDLISGQERRPVYQTTSDMVKSGEVAKIRPGVYVYQGKKGQKPQLRAIIWRLIRSRRTFTLADIAELSGAKESYVEEYVNMLCHQDVVKSAGNGSYRLVNDPVIMPENEEKAARLRALRRQRKACVLAALNAAKLAIAKAEAELNGDDE